MSLDNVSNQVIGVSAYHSLCASAWTHWLSDGCQVMFTFDKFRLLVSVLMLNSNWVKWHLRFRGILYLKNFMRKLVSCSARHHSCVIYAITDSLL